MYINKIFNEDCLIGMNRIPDGVIDLVVCDLPYGTTNLKWDTIIPFGPLWEQYKRVCKPDAAILLFSAQPFTTDLINSNRKMFKYEIIWKKTQCTGFFDAKKRPLRLHENILLFYSKQPTYNPQKVIKENAVGIGRHRGNSESKKTDGGFVGKVGKEKAETYFYEEKGLRYPTDVIEFSNWNGALFGNTDRSKKHPTQKPVHLIEYLIKTYSNDGDLVLDNCIGSGTTAVAAINTGRRFVGFETNKEYFEYANDRINAAIHGDCGHSSTSADKNQLQLLL